MLRPPSLRWTIFDSVSGVQLEAVPPPGKHSRTVELYNLVAESDGPINQVRTRRLGVSVSDRSDSA